jgi:hypothetical protein
MEEGMSQMDSIFLGFNTTVYYCLFSEQKLLWTSHKVVIRHVDLFIINV